MCGWRDAKQLEPPKAAPPPSLRSAAFCQLVSVVSPFVNWHATTTERRNADFEAIISRAEKMPERNSRTIPRNFRQVQARQLGLALLPYPYYMP